MSEFLNPELVNKIFYTFIGLVFFSNIITLLSSYTKISSQVKKALKVFQTESENKHEYFYDNFLEISEKITQLQIYSHSWKEFCEHLIHDSENPIVYNSILPEVFFSKDVIVYENINQKHYDAVPGYLTGLGILGTFVGFSIALASLDISNIDSENIGGLLKGAETAFNTSILGILSSIMFSLFEKNRIKRLDNRSDIFIDGL